jgi:hypothetical protein
MMTSEWHCERIKSSRQHTATPILDCYSDAQACGTRLALEEHLHCKLQVVRLGLDDLADLLSAREFILADLKHMKLFVSGTRNYSTVQLLSRHS